MASQQSRYMVVMVIVLLTIFIYVIYSTNEMQVPGRLHTPAPLSQSANAYLLAGNDNHHESLSENGTNKKGIGMQDESDKRMYISEISNISNHAPDIIQNIQAPDTKSNSKEHIKNSLNIETDTSAAAKNDLNKMPNKTGSSFIKNITNATSPAPPSSISVPANSPLDTTKGIKTSEFYEGGHIESNTEICPESGGPVRLLILITSAPSHTSARLAIRQTWGHYGIRRDISIAFMLGSTRDISQEEQLDQENYMYGDLIRGHFIDSYNNLTLKTISLLEWVDKYCSNANFILKTDDDMFINVPKLLTFIEKRNKDTRTIYGRLAKKWKPIRNKKSKYYVSVKQYYPPVFPQFTTGPAYLMTSDCIHDLYTKSLDQTYLKLEDVFTTGIVAHLSNIKRIHVNEFVNRRIAFNPCNVKKAISIHMVKSNEQFDLWKKLQDVNTKCK